MPLSYIRSLEYKFSSHTSKFSIHAQPTLLFLGSTQFVWGIFTVFRLGEGIICLGSLPFDIASNYVGAIV